MKDTGLAPVMILAVLVCGFLASVRVCILASGLGLFAFVSLALLALGGLRFAFRVLHVACYFV